MQRRVALFRGVNVGGHNKLPMADLHATFGDLGCTDVVTIIQSGNVCFDSPLADAVLTASIRTAVADHFGIDVPVTLRTAAEFTNALAAHPFAPGPVEPKLHHIMFLADPPPPDAAARIGDHSPDEFVVIGREIHVRYPEGSARSRLSVDLVDRRLGTVATARNLPTCDKIAAALGAGD